MPLLPRRTLKKRLGGWRGGVEKVMFAAKFSERVREVISQDNSPATGVQDSNNKILLRDFWQPQELMGERDKGTFLRGGSWEGPRQA